MSILNQQLNPPSDWQAFERLCFDLYSGMWGDPNAQMHGRSGQEQWGVDIFGHDEHGLFTGVQCKGKTGGYGSRLTERERRDEVEKAKHFSPSLDVFIVATTSPADAKLQRVAGNITQLHKAAGLAAGPAKRRVGSTRRGGRTACRPRPAASNPSRRAAEG